MKRRLNLSGTIRQILENSGKKNMFQRTMCLKDVQIAQLSQGSRIAEIVPGLIPGHFLNFENFNMTQLIINHVN